MRKVLLSTAAAVTALMLVAAPASAQPRHFGGHGFGLAALAIGVIGAAVGAEIISHERSEPECRTRAVNYYDGYGDLVEKKKDTVCRD
jgi:hypothetical protein